MLELKLGDATVLVGSTYSKEMGYAGIAFTKTKKKDFEVGVVIDSRDYEDLPPPFLRIISNSPISFDVIIEACEKAKKRISEMDLERYKMNLEIHEDESII